MWVGLLLSVLAFAALAQGNKVWSIKANNVDDVKRVHELADVLNLDIWHHPRNLEDAFHIFVPQEYYQVFGSWLDRIHIESTVMVEDVERLIEEEQASIKRSRMTSSFSSFNFNTYNNFSVIQKYLSDLAADTSQLNVEIKDIGYTYEDRPITVIKLSDKGGDVAKSIFMDCGIHAREWISPAFCMYVINQLISTTNEDMLKKYNWYIVPVLNPDGYTYSFESYRMWRKNRFKNANSNCYGVDLNRNFGYQYNPDTGGSRDPCHDIYAGTEAFSEAESKAVSNFITNLQTEANVHFDAYLTIHSYGQMWLYPWGYTSALPADWEDLQNVAEVACDALTAVNRKRYAIGSSTNVLYSAAGGSDDWAKGGADIKYSYTLELRDTGRYGFVLPTNQIEPTCIETWAALKAMVNVLQK